ncbi:hypothetical protein TNCV_5118761 [Trichonephila clavipes]|nr:hypothetical protein TNCV_5118761 [Trichonephila clavipes]
MIVQFRNEKVSNHGSIPITIDCNVVAFIVFEEGFHQPIKRTKHPTVSSEEFDTVDDDNVCTAPIMTDKDILDIIQSSKNIIDADSDDENEMNNAAPVPRHPK